MTCNSLSIKIYLRHILIKFKNQNENWLNVISKKFLGISQRFWLEIGIVFNTN